MFGRLFVDTKFFSYVNSCSHLLCVNNAQITSLNVSTITNVSNLNVSEGNVSLINNVSCINSGLNQNLAIVANQLNLSLYTNVCFY